MRSETRTVNVTDLFDPSGSWWNNSPAVMYAGHLILLAARTRDPAMTQQAILAMRQSLALYPQWPQGWSELAGLAAGGSDVRTQQSAALQIALDAATKALTLDERWPADDLRKFSPQERNRLVAVQEKIHAKLTAATQPASPTH